MVHGHSRKDPEKYTKMFIFCQSGFKVKGISLSVSAEREVKRGARFQKCRKRPREENNFQSQSAKCGPKMMMPCFALDRTLSLFLEQTKWTHGAYLGCFGTLGKTRKCRLMLVESAWPVCPPPLTLTPNFAFLCCSARCWKQGCVYTTLATIWARA